MTKYDLTGKTFGKLTVLSKSSKTDGKNSYWNCLCYCGTIKSFQRPHLTKKQISCGCITSALSTIDQVKISAAKKIFSDIYSDGDLLFEDFYNLSQQACFYCGLNAVDSNCAKPFKNAKNASSFTKNNCEFRYNGLDRIDNNKTHNKNNVVSCCKTCNNFKLDSTIENFFERILLLNINPVIISIDELNNINFKTRNNFTQLKKKGKRKNREFELSKIDYLKLVSANCIYCNKKSDIKNNYLNGIDRIDSKIGYITKNCTTACLNCNIGKNNLTMEQFIEWIKRIKNYQLNKDIK